MNSVKEFSCLFYFSVKQTRHQGNVDPVVGGGNVGVDNPRSADEDEDTLSGPRTQSSDVDTAYLELSMRELQNNVYAELHPLQ